MNRLRRLRRAFADAAYWTVVLLNACLVLAVIVFGAVMILETQHGTVSLEILAGIGAVMVSLTGALYIWRSL